MSDVADYLTSIERDLSPFLSPENKVALKAWVIGNWDGRHVSPGKTYSVTVGNGGNFRWGQMDAADMMATHIHHGCAAPAEFSPGVQATIARWDAMHATEANMQRADEPAYTADEWAASGKRVAHLMAHMPLERLSEIYPAFDGRNHTGAQQKEVTSSAENEPAGDESFDIEADLIRLRVGIVSASLGRGALPAACVDSLRAALAAYDALAASQTPVAAPTKPGVPMAALRARHVPGYGGLR